MTATDVTQLLLFLAATYGRQFDYPSGDESRDTLKEGVWHEQLKGYDKGAVLAATKALIGTGGQWPPHPGMIIAQLLRMTEPGRSGAEAWHLTISAIRRHGAIYGAKNIQAELPGEVWNTILLFGLENIANHDPSDTYLMNRFIKQYEQQAEIERERRLYVPPKLGTVKYLGLEEG